MKQPLCERRLTRLDYYLGITLLGGALLLGDWGIHHAQAGPAMPAVPAVLSAREFDVVDAAGHVEAKLRSRTADDTNALEVYDEKDVKRVAVKVHAGQGTAVNLYGTDGVNRMTIAVLDDSDETNVVQLSKDGKEVMAVDSFKGQGNIEFKRPDGSVKIVNGQ